VGMSAGGGVLVIDCEVVRLWGVEKEVVLEGEKVDRTLNPFI
jgi:hypothetical protein